MNARAIIVAALAAALAACGNTSDGRISMDVQISGLTDAQNFCFTWELLQLDDEGDWILIDRVTDPICGDAGVDKLSSVGTCYGGRRFLVVYDVDFYEGETRLGGASGTSGGSEEDVCEMNHDTPSTALFQFGNTGNVGGVNPGVRIDQVCANDKVEEENGRVVTALWLQNDACAGGTPDSYCVLGSGSQIETLRYGVTIDGNIRFLFNQAPLSATWKLYYLAFEPEVAAGELILQQNPWVLSHHASGYSRGTAMMEDARVAFRYDDEDGINVGFVHYDGEHLRVVHDQTGDCDGPIALDSVTDEVAIPGCEGDLAMLGAIAVGGPRFELVFQCGEAMSFMACDATADVVCVPSEKD